MNTKMFLWLITVVTIFSCQNLCVSSLEYKISWVVPKANASDTFNVWASKKRFQIGDILQFKYKKDSVMEVNLEDYKQCNASHPRTFSNTGMTRFRFDHSGPFYFISGMSGHCEKGQKMIVKVISQDQDGGDDHRATSSAPDAVLSAWFCFVLLFQSVSSFVASHYFF